jgi:hypothetical protein
MVQLEGLGKLKKFNDLIGTQTCDHQHVAYHLNNLHFILHSIQVLF